MSRKDSILATVSLSLVRLCLLQDNDCMLATSTYNSVDVTAEVTDAVSREDVDKQETKRVTAST